MKDHYLKLPEKPDRAVIEAIYRAWDHYQKPGNSGVLGSSEAERIYREIYRTAGESKLLECLIEVLYEYECAGYCASDSLIEKSKDAIRKAGGRPK